VDDEREELVEKEKRRTLEDPVGGRTHLKCVGKTEGKETRANVYRVTEKGEERRKSQRKLRQARKKNKP
jgi:hypothetical protein